jgi:L-galactose dehydrogenase/L-glyceraldehyde 3-phosphate reductase
VKRRLLGRTGLSVSEIGFGCGPTAGLMIRADAKMHRDAVARALELGIDYFDTAPVYGDTQSERHLGAALVALGAKPFIATKVALELGDLDDIPGAVTRSVEASIARLGVPRLGLVQLHNRVGGARAAKADIGTGALLTVDDVLAAGGVVPTLERLRARGLVGHFGCCAFGGEAQAIARLIDSGAFDTILVHYSVLNPSAWRDAGAGLRDYAQLGAHAVGSGMGVVALRVLDGGALTGANVPPALAALADETGHSVPVLALRFALSNTAISTALVGFSDAGQIDAAVAAAAAGPLPTEMLARIERLHATNFGRVAAR